MERAEPGWYFYVECVNCREDIIFKKAPPAEEINPVLVQGVTVSCPRCKTEHTYPALQVKRGVVEDNTK